MPTSLLLLGIMSAPFWMPPRPRRIKPLRIRPAPIFASLSLCRALRKCISSKVNTRELIAAFDKSGRLPDESPAATDGSIAIFTDQKNAEVLCAGQVVRVAPVNQREGPAGFAVKVIDYRFLHSESRKTANRRH